MKLYHNRLIWASGFALRYYYVIKLITNIDNVHDVGVGTQTYRNNCGVYR